MDIVSMGRSSLLSIGKKIGNLFWREIFVSVQAVMKEALSCVPEKILLAPFWGNPAFA